MPIETIDAETYARERAICDAAAAYVERVCAAPARNYLTAEEAAAPIYAACDNDMRGRVEQYEILRDLPETIVAYIGSMNAGSDMPRGSGRGATYPVTVWTGLPIGYATRGSTWRTPGSYVSSTMSQFYATIGGREYTGRGAGEGSGTFGPTGWPVRGSGSDFVS